MEATDAPLSLSLSLTQLSPQQGHLFDTGKFDLDQHDGMTVTGLPVRPQTVQGQVQGARSQIGEGAVGRSRKRQLWFKLRNVPGSHRVIVLFVCQATVVPDGRQFIRQGSRMLLGMVGQ